MWTCFFVKVAVQFSSQNIPMERRDPVLRLSRIWPYWADDDKSLLLMGVRTVWVARMEFPLVAVTMGLSEVGITSFQRWTCAGAIYWLVAPVYAMA